MTELMKRYEAETGECATWTWQVGESYNNENTREYRAT